jgi:hypothetical protein
VTTVPDWLAERVALSEVPPASRDRLTAADPAELEQKTAAIAEANARELASHPPDIAVAQIEARLARAPRPARSRRAAWLAGAGALVSAAAAVLVVSHHVGASTPPPPPWPHLAGDGSDVEITRAKGTARLTVFRRTGERAERLDPDALARAGDTLQLRYDAGGRRYGVIASVDGAGVVTLHYPAAESAPAADTVLAARATALPQAYALDDAPRFERFFFITANDPIDVGDTLATLRTFAQRPDAADADLPLPTSFQQWSLRVLKAGSP